MFVCLELLLLHVCLFGIIIIAYLFVWNLDAKTMSGTFLVATLIEAVNETSCPHPITVYRHQANSSSFSSRWHRSSQKGPYALRSVSQQSPQGCPRNSTNACLVEHRSSPASEGGTSAAPSLQPVQAMTLKRQTSDRVATTVPIFKLLV